MITLGNILEHDSSLKTEDGYSAPVSGDLDSLDLVLSTMSNVENTMNLEDSFKALDAVSDTINILMEQDDHEECLRVEDASNLPVVSVVADSKEEAGKTMSFKKIKDLIIQFWDWLWDKIKHMDEVVGDLILSSKLMFANIDKRRDSLLKDIAGKDGDKFNELKDGDKYTVRKNLVSFGLYTGSIEDATFNKIQSAFKDFKKNASVVLKMSKSLKDIDSGLELKDKDDISLFAEKLNIYVKWWDSRLDDLPKYIRDISGTVTENLKNLPPQPDSNSLWYRSENVGLLSTLGRDAGVVPYSFKGTMIRYCIYANIAGGEAERKGLLGHANFVNTIAVKVNDRKLRDDKEIKVNQVSLNSIEQALKASAKIDFKSINKDLQMAIREIKSSKPKDVLGVDPKNEALSAEQKSLAIGRVRLMVNARKVIMTMAKDILSDNIALTAGFVKSSSLYVNAYDDKK